MSEILVLLAPDRSAALTPQLLDQIVSPVPHAHRSKPEWLASQRSCEIYLSRRDGNGFGPWASAKDFREFVMRTIVQSDHEGAPIDIALLENDNAHRRKRLLVADMESTIIKQELIDEMADYVGRREEIESITARAMRGDLDFEGALRERVAMLAGLDARVLDEVYEERVTLMPGAETLVRTMKANGAYCALVSGGFTVFTERVARRLGFDEHQANVLEIEGGRLTGRVREPILGREAKRQTLERLTTRLGLSPADTLAVGDGANDLDMISAAGLGVAFRAKAVLREAARGLPNGAAIDHGDLTALLYLQGYRQEELVA